MSLIIAFSCSLFMAFFESTSTFFSSIKIRFSSNCSLFSSIATFFFSISSKVVRLIILLGLCLPSSLDFSLKVAFQMPLSNPFLLGSFAFLYLPFCWLVCC
eukprot:NODE_483_length_6934_cov_0.583175.p3 type:complete len:101 gc:universal NODE_483_length_6934_cov_0.583175:5611-5913(+)